jgi:hypothetical protein
VTAQADTGPKATKSGDYGFCLNNAATVPHRLMAARFSGVLVISLGL